MSNPIIECIPNFSEARRPDVVAEIIETIESVDSISVLDQHSDIDHNRTVVTFVGPPEAVEEAAFQAIAKAAENIDLDNHQGEHPRIGATDVVPFVPISDITMVECVEMARRLGKRVGETLKIPVYLYEEAATRPDRVNLENIRRGQYETLKKEIGKNPNRNPDYGPVKLTGAGATVIGARQPLVAFNVYLTTNDVSIANKIARAIRHSSGGLRFVKSMGILVEGRAQVSMNLTNYRRTSMARVVEMIRREAGRYGVQIHHSELVGLVPNEALVDAAVWYMQMDQFEPEQILETRLFENISKPKRHVSAVQESSFLDDLASGEPTPGGGSASAYGAAMAASLVAMVGRLTVGKKKYKEVEGEVWPLIEQAIELQDAMKEAVAKDADAFDAYMKALRLPKDTDQQKSDRIQAIQAASINAAEVPLHVARNALTIMRLALKMAQLGNLNAITDAGTGAAFTAAAIRGAGLNVRVNLLGLEKEADPARMLNELEQIEKQAGQVENDLQDVLSERGGLN
ncbi:MAG: glutamate formimidoyltransferase, partial [Chloroflexota bacterium]|nr:glutamate formimidoyltransferase [Chloroflexota bacterium]